MKKEMIELLAEGFLGSLRRGIEEEKKSLIESGIPESRLVNDPSQNADSPDRSPRQADPLPAKYTGSGVR